jgi:hypothetical protein
MLCRSVGAGFTFTLLALRNEGSFEGFTLSFEGPCDFCTPMVFIGAPPANFRRPDAFDRGRPPISSALL